MLGLLARALVPVGLMPAPASAGGPLIFCHGGAAGAFFRALAAAGAERPAAADALHDHAAGVDAAQPHTGHHLDHLAGHHSSPDQAASTLEPAAAGAPLGTDDPSAEHRAWENCSFNGAFAQAALAPTFELPLLALEHARTPIVPPAHSTTVAELRYWARGPPLRTT